jgi:large subunit ribosomal protein L25
MESTLKAEKRDTRGKNEARRLRVAERIPAVLYGGTAGEASVALAVEPKVLSRILHSDTGVNTLIDLAIEGQAPTKVLVKEFQLNPVTHALLHADFYRVSMDRPITVTVSIDLRGEPKGVKQQDGVLDFVTREIQIEVLPANIPGQIVVDVSDLVIGQDIRVRDVAKDVPWTAITDGDVLIAHVIAHRGEETAEAAATAETPAAGATAEPEVIKKGKAEKEGD